MKKLMLIFIAIVLVSCAKSYQDNKKLMVKNYEKHFDTNANGITIERGQVHELGYDGTLDEVIFLEYDTVSNDIMNKVVKNYTDVNMTVADLKTEKENIESFKSNIATWESSKNSIYSVGDGKMDKKHLEESSAKEIEIREKLDKLQREQFALAKEKDAEGVFYRAYFKVKFTSEKIGKIERVATVFFDKDLKVVNDIFLEEE